MNPLSDSERAAIRAFLCWRGWSVEAADAKIDEFVAGRQPSPRSHERAFKGAV